MTCPCVSGGTASACSGSSVANISRAHSDGNLSSAAERIRDSKVRDGTFVCGNGDSVVLVVMLLGLTNATQFSPERAHRKGLQLYKYLFSVIFKFHKCHLDFYSTKPDPSCYKHVPEHVKFQK